MTQTIKFGTDGWRGTIADDYTFENVRRAAQGFASFLVQGGQQGQTVIVGYDKRFASEYFAAAVAEVLAANGLIVHLTDRATPTPVISFSVVDHKAVGAVNITASHNPPTDNGFKVRDAHGGAIDPDGLKKIESLIPASVDQVKRQDFEQASAAGHILKFDATPAYVAHLKDLIDLEPIRKASLTVMVDSMWGNGGGWFASLLAGGSTRVVEIHKDRNPSFPEMKRPEPIQPNIDVGLQATLDNHADVLLITDGDADRLGVGDEHGQFINQMQVYAILAYYLLEIRGWRGPLIKTTTTTQMVDVLAAKYGVPVDIVKIGFKYAAPKMMQVNALMAGEESGSYGFRGLPERDGLLAGLFVLDFMQHTNSKASDLLEKIEAVVGKYYFGRTDIPVAEAERGAILEHLLSPSLMQSISVSSVDRSDGVKFVFGNGDWLFFRFSGTEPVIRVAVESRDPAALEALLRLGTDLIASKR